MLQIAMLLILTGDGPLPSNNPINGSTLGPLRYEAIRDELGLSTSQRQQIDKELKLWSETFERYENSTRAERQTLPRMRTEIAKRDKAVKEILNKQQKGWVSSLYFCQRKGADLMDRSVRAELKISRKQALSINELDAQWNLKWLREFKGGKKIVINRSPLVPQGYDGRMKEWTKQSAKLLNAKQFERYQQVQLQVRAAVNGPEVLVSQRVKMHLSLSDSQIQAVRGAQTNERVSFSKRRRVFVGVYESFSAAQKKQWLALLGKPYSFYGNNVPGLMQGSPTIK